jgi:hypothetical protein
MHGITHVKIIKTFLCLVVKIDIFQVRQHNRKILFTKKKKYRDFISEEDTFLWLLGVRLIAGTESEAAAAQNWALQTKCDATKILETETNNKCRLCYQYDETIDHIISECPILAQQYIKRHDSVCVCVHNYILTCARKMG